MNSGASKKLCRLTAALMLSVSCAAIERAEAGCDPTTSAATPVNNTTVTCSGTTTNQNDPNGWGTGNEADNTINVQGTLSGLLHGISVETGNRVINSGSLSGGAGDGIHSFGNLSVTNNVSGIISGSLFGIFTNLFRSGSAVTLTVDNNGTIKGDSNGSSAVVAQGDITVSNIGDGVTNGIIKADQNAISGQTINVSGNTGRIESTGATGIAILSFGDLTVNNSSGGLITSLHRTLSGGNVSVTNNAGGVIETTGSGTSGTGITANNLLLDNSGVIRAIGADAIGAIEIVNTGTSIKNSGTISTVGITSQGSFAVGSDFGGLTVNNLSGGTIEALVGNGIAIAAGRAATADVNVTNAGVISATGAGGIAIQASGTATVSNFGNGVTTGIISGDISAIQANTVIVTGNTGLIEATGANGIAIDASATGGTANITSSGNIQASSIAIVTNGLLTLNNAGSVTSGGLFAVVSNSGDVNVTNSGTISADNGTAIQAGGQATVGNAPGATISGATDQGGLSFLAGAIATNGQLTLNNAGLVVSDGGAFAVQSNNADVNITNSGTIRAKNGVAIQAAGTATVSNSGDGVNTGVIVGGTNAIQANAVIVSSNAGSIASPALNGIAIIATTDATVTNSGIIRADNGTGIQAGGTAHVTNLSGGNITAGGTAISAISLDVTNGQGALINGGANGISGSGTVTNAGTITGNTASVSFGGTGNNKLILQTGSALNGDAIGALGVTNDLVLQGHGIVANNFLNFTSLDVQADTAWTWGSSANFGTTTITSGTLAVDGTLISPVAVNAGSTLAGHGNVNGNVTVAGAIAPGAVTPLSTLTVAGNVTFNSGSIYRVNINASGQNDKLAVTGATNTATLSGGTVNVHALNGIALSVPYMILSAEGGLGGTTFAGVASNFIFLKPALSYDANDVFLTFGTAAGIPGGTIGFANVAQTQNQRAVAGALDASPVSSPLVLALLNQTSAAGALQAFDALSGEVFSSVHNVQTGQMHFMRETMLGRMRQASYYDAPGELGALSFGGPELAYADGSHAPSAADVGGVYAADFPAQAAPGKAPPAPRGPSRDLTFWAQGLGGWAHADSDGNAASLKSRFGGFLSGADARFGDAWRAGLVAGYMRTDLNVADRSSSAGVDSVQFGGYAGGKLGVFNVRAGASYSYDSIDTSRTIFFPGFTDKANAHFHGNVGQVFGEVGYGMTLGPIAVEPLAGLAYVHVRDGSFNEAGGLAALSSASANESTGYSTLGVRAATAVPLANGTVLVPRGSVQWQYAFGDVTPVNALAFQSTGTSFTVAGIPIARNSALVEAGFDWRFSPQAKLGAFYQGELAAHAESHAFKGAFTWDF